MKKKIEALAFYLLAIGILVFLANVSSTRPRLQRGCAGVAFVTHSN